jgi:pyruvate/2-oxoglutarate dehydrogenase complex dihydrolipoamide acyltransferase (E2) component
MRVTPVGRQVAREHGLDLAAVTGTGRGGRITRRDVEAYLAATSAPPAAQPPAGGTTAMSVDTPAPTAPAASGLNDAPTAWLLVEVDLTSVERASAARGGALPALAFVLQAVARTLVQQPLLNATWTPTALRLHPTVVLAVVMAGGTTTIIDAAERLTVAELARALAGAGQAAPSATPTVTVFVADGPGRATWQPGLPPDQVAAVVVVGPTRQLVAAGDTVAARSVASLSVVFDHRALDGAPVGRFARAVRDWLEGDAGSPSVA